MTGTRSMKAALRPRHLVSVVVGLIFSLDLIGCDYHFIHKANIANDVHLEDDTSVIIGRITLPQCVTPPLCLMPHTWRTMGFVNLSAPDNIIDHQLSEDGYFYLQLEPGDYKIDYVTCIAACGLLGEGHVDPTRSVIIDLRFSVGRNRILYIGTMNITYEGISGGWSSVPEWPCSSILTGSLPANKLCVATHSRVDVADEYGSAIKQFKERYPGITKEVEDVSVRGRGR
jgi:hypothetical protein